MPGPSLGFMTRPLKRMDGTCHLYYKVIIILFQLNLEVRQLTGTRTSELNMVCNSSIKSLNKAILIPSSKTIG